MYFEWRLNSLNKKFMRMLILLLKSLILFPVKIFSKISIFAMVNESSIHSTSAVIYGSRIYFSSIARYSYVARNCTISHTKIGAFCSIADHVIINPPAHPLHFAATSPIFYSKKNALGKCFNSIDFKEFDQTIIGNDVWIGSHALIKGGITIGHGAVIGAYTIVTKDVEPYSVMVGNPGKVIRKRFDDAIIKKLLLSKWWDLDDNNLQKKSININNVDSFL